jgi:hypothetical protein
MAKSKITEIKKETHKFVVEGEVTVENNLIVVNVPDEGVKNLHELVKNFNGEYCKITFQEDREENLKTE